MSRPEAMAVLTNRQRQLLEACASEHGTRIHTRADTAVMERLFRKDYVIRSCNGTDKWHATQLGREALAHAEPGSVYVDRETGEEMYPVSMVLPLAPSASALPRTPDNLRACRRCDQLLGLDVSDCPYCGLRQTAL